MNLKLNITFAVAVASVLFTATLYAAPPEKISVDVKRLSDLEMRDFVVQFHVPQDFFSLGKVAGGNGQLKKSLRSNTFVLRLPAIVAKLLQANPQIRYVTIDRAV